MPKGPASPDLPHLTVDEVSNRDHQESRLRTQLSACWRGDDFDVERAFHIIRACAVEIIDVVYPAYRKKTGFAARWVPLIVNEAIHRTLINSEDHVRNGVLNLSLDQLGKILETTLVDHLKTHPELISPSDFYAAFPKLWTPAPPAKLAPPPPPGEYASAYSASGIDIASGSPLLVMAMTAARGAHPQSPRLSSQITSPSAARKMEAFMEDNALNQTEFAIQANTSDKTIRKFRQTGKVKRSILTGIASAMGITKEELLRH
jgi:hypothetical protein